MPDFPAIFDAAKNLGGWGVITAILVGLLRISEQAIKYRQESDRERLKSEVDDNRERIKSADARIELLQGQLDAANERLLPIAEDRARAIAEKGFLERDVEHWRRHAKKLDEDLDREREEKRMMRIELTNKDQIVYGMKSIIAEYNDSRIRDLMLEIRRERGSDNGGQPGQTS